MYNVKGNILIGMFLRAAQPDTCLVIYRNSMQLKQNSWMSKHKVKGSFKIKIYEVTGLDLQLILDTSTSYELL